MSQRLKVKRKTNNSAKAIKVKKTTDMNDIKKINGNKIAVSKKKR